MGTDSPHIEGIMASVQHQGEGDSICIVLDADVTWDTRCNIGAFFKSLGGLVTMKVQKFSLRGTLRISCSPETGSVKVYFLHRPEVSIKFGGTTEVLNWAPVNALSEFMNFGTVNSQVSDYIFNREPYEWKMQDPVCSQCATPLPSQNQVSPRILVRDLKQEDVYPVMGAVYSMQSSAILRIVVAIFIAHYCKHSVPSPLPSLSPPEKLKRGKGIIKKIKKLCKISMPTPHMDLDPKSWETVRLHDVICVSEEFLRGLRGGKPALTLDCMEEFLDDYASIVCDHTVSGNEQVDPITIKFFLATNCSYYEHIVDEYGYEQGFEYLESTALSAVGQMTHVCIDLSQRGKLNISMSHHINVKYPWTLSNHASFLRSLRHPLPLVFPVPSRKIEERLRKIKKVLQN